MSLCLGRECSSISISSVEAHHELEIITTNISIVICRGHIHSARFRFLAVASASQRLAKLLQNKGKPKQAPQQSQPQTAPAITAAMRQHASQRVTKALQANSSLGLESTQAEAETGASRWESDIFSSSNSKSAYLSKLSNAVSQIRRATDLAQLELPAAAWVPDQATAAARLLGPNMADMANQPPAAGQPSDRVGSSLHAPASDLQSTPVHTPSGPKQLLIVPSPPLQPASGSQLHELMQELKSEQHLGSYKLCFVIQRIDHCACLLQQ